MSIWVMALISGVLCTQIVNPFFWFQLGRCIKSYRIAVRTYRQTPDSCRKPVIREYLKEELGSFKKIIIGNIIVFVIFYVIFGLSYYFSARARIFPTIILHMPCCLIGSFITTIISFSGTKKFEKMGFCLKAIASAIIMFIVVPMVFFIHADIYNSADTNALVHKAEAQEKVDISLSLKERVLIEDYALWKLVSRNEKVVFPIRCKDGRGNISIVGYVELNDDGTFKIVKKELCYTPYQGESQDIEYIAREYLPTKQFFGDWSFELSPDGDMYFARIYGDFDCLLAGRKITGVLLVNAMTGECQAIALDEVPNWLSGILEYFSLLLA